MKVTKLDFENKLATVAMKDTWEHKINVAQKKNKNGNFLPAHFAGIFSGLFSSTIWFEITQHQLEGKSILLLNISLLILPLQKICML